MFFIRDEDFELKFVSEPLIKRLSYASFDEVPPTKHWRYDPTKVSTTRAFMKSKPLNEAFVLPEVTEIRTKEGGKLSFVETFKWFEDPITDRRMLMTSYEDVTELLAEKEKIEILRKRSEKILEVGVNAFIIEDDKDNVLYASPAVMALFKFTSLSQFVVSEDFYVDLDPVDLSDFRAVLARAPEEKITKWGARKVRCGDGSIVTVEVSYSWFQDVDEKEDA